MLTDDKMDVPLDHPAMSNVKRWHVINTAREQTLGDHSFQVTAILDRAVVQYALSGDPWEPRDIIGLLRAGLYHDAHEVWVGDRPTCAKQFERLANVVRSPFTVARYRE